MKIGFTTYGKDKNLYNETETLVKSFEKPSKTLLMSTRPTEMYSKLLLFIFITEILSEKK